MARYIDADNIRLKGIPVFDQNLEVLIPLSDVRKALQMTPTADVQEVKHAKWITIGKDITERVVCSNCYSHKGSNLKPPFCNQCGAKMDGEE